MVFFRGRVILVSRGLIVGGAARGVGVALSVSV